MRLRDQDTYCTAADIIDLSRVYVPCLSIPRHTQLFEASLPMRDYNTIILIFDKSGKLYYKTEPCMVEWALRRLKSSDTNTI
ncbi:MAG: hypothetical protein PHD11_08380 [Bacteroidales bacterium]|nr:hypothetical protein [Bacteroidales bacterium]